MAMLSLSTPANSSASLFSAAHCHHNPLRGHFFQKGCRTATVVVRRPISASKLPTPPPYPPPIGQVYQPFRPPPSPLPDKYRSLDPLERLEILRNRLGLWHEYAPLLTALSHDGFTPPSIEEATGITGVEQNRFVVAAQVRDSLLSSPSSFNPELIAWFDAVGGAELLYELRFLNAAQRAAAANRVVELNIDPKAAQELARAIKDFRLRRGDDSWNRFSGASPGDCLAYTHFRLSKEMLSAAERLAALERAMEAVETEEAKIRIAEEMERASGRAGAKEEEEEGMRVTVPVLRLRYGEVAEASTVALLPVCRAEDGEEGILAAPGRCTAVGELGVVAVEKAWARWAVLPGWAPVSEAAAEGGGVAVEFMDGRVLPWRASRKWEAEEAVLVVADRRRRKVAEEGDNGGYYLVAGEEEKKELVVERGVQLAEHGVKEALGKVVLVVRPPKEDDDQLSEYDWE